MNILVSIPRYNDQMSGVEYHRCFTPFKNIPNSIFTHNIEFITDEFIKENDIGIVWFNRNIAPHTLDPDKVYKVLRRNKIKIVCDLDDSWDIPFGHILYDISIKANLKNSMKSQIINADYICCTHDVLASKVEKDLGVKRHKIIIAPNGIDQNEPQFKQNFNYKLENIIWQGSVTHHEDLKQIAAPINDLDLKIFIAGYDPNSHSINKDGTRHYHWEDTGRLFNRKQWIHSHTPQSYMNIYQNKGLALIPLQKSNFTSCKSNLKMLEAGWAKKPVVCSGVFPYTSLGTDGKNCEFAYTKESWKDSIDYLLKNPNYADDLRFKLYEDVKENYLIEKVNESRINLIEKIK